jgi:hypothetical protein
VAFSRVKRTVGRIGKKIARVASKNPKIRRLLRTRAATKKAIQQHPPREAVVLRAAILSCIFPARGLDRHGEMRSEAADRRRNAQDVRNAGWSVHDVGRTNAFSARARTELSQAQLLFGSLHTPRDRDHFLRNAIPRYAELLYDARNPNANKSGELEVGLFLASHSGHIDPRAFKDREEHLRGDADEYARLQDACINLDIRLPHAHAEFISKENERLRHVADYFTRLSALPLQTRRELLEMGQRYLSQRLLEMEQKK